MMFIEPREGIRAVAGVRDYINIKLLKGMALAQAIVLIINNVNESMLLIKAYEKANKV
jgi:hypothetical protein